MYKDCRPYLERARRLCLRSEKTEYDIRQKLQVWQVPGKCTESIIKSLIEDQFIDEERFARAFIKDKIFLNHWGKMKVSYGLRQKQLTGQWVEALMKEVDDMAYRDMLFKQAENKLRQLRKKENNPYRLKAKLMAFLQQRGVESNLCYEIADSLI